MSRLARVAMLLVSIIIAFVAGSNGWAAEKATTLTPARIALVSRSTLDLPFWVARKAGEGLR